MNSPKPPFSIISYFSSEKGIFILLSSIITLSLFILDPFCYPLMCSLSANLVTFESCIFTSTSSIGKFFYNSMNIWIRIVYMDHLYDLLLKRQTFLCWQSQLDVRSQLVVRSIACGLKSIFSFLPMR